MLPPRGDARFGYAETFGSRGGALKMEVVSGVSNKERSHRGVLERILEIASVMKFLGLVGLALSLHLNANVAQ